MRTKKNTDIIGQYKGVLNTPNLWKKNVVFDLNQLDITSTIHNIDNPEIFNEKRLGKRVEQFFEYQINNSTNYKLIACNIQIKNDKLTIGELDALVLKDGLPIHIEIVYKFYLYDPNIKTNNELEKWIGPNRKDTLIYKLKKLKEKQLPLLYSKFCNPILSKLNLDVTKIMQQVYYKTQLFLPLNFKVFNITPLNGKCISGFYLSFTEIEKLNGYKIHIPKKINWLIKPNRHVKWFSFEDGKIEIKKFIFENRSPMVWLQSSNNNIQKCFITFW